MNEDELRTHQERMLAHAEHIIARNEFSVCEFSANGSYTYTARFVSAGEAIASAKRSMRSGCARDGALARVIITDGGDCIVFEWRQGTGVIFPELLYGAFRCSDNEDDAAG